MKIENESISLRGLPFVKMTGTGNDFLLFDARSEAFPQMDRSAFSRSVCRRSLSVGADGVVFIERSEKPGSDFRWDFYNADGSHAPMCGNASRCVSRYAYDRKIAGEKLCFETAAGLISGRVLAGSMVEVTLPGPRILEEKTTVPLGEHLTMDVMVLNTGVPHVVRENDDWDDEYLTDMGRYLRHHELFRKYGGANATFYEVSGPSTIQSATFERGVEGVTMACGTGAVAAATAAFIKGEASPVTINVPGGTLKVELEKNLESAILTGEARYICVGQLQLEALL